MAMFSASINQFILKLVLLSFWHASIDSKDVVVDTNFGKVRGQTRYFIDQYGQQKDVHIFLGIPYAKPPVKNLRFKPPLPNDPWEPEQLDARQFGNVCPQSEAYLDYLATSIKKVWPEFSRSKHVNEDCLHLNIFVPATSEEGPVYPVLFYIHGGTYLIGTPARDKTQGHIFSQLHDVILVTIQYRLGPLGFLTAGDSVLPGNYGMLDQVAALKWVNQNIAHFKGDPKRITIAGNSAGGSSVALHLLSPLTTGLFQRAILESGVEFSPFAILPLEKAVEKTKTVANKLLCETGNTTKMVECLRSKDIADMIYYYKEFPGPVVDKYFLPDTPENLRKQGKAKSVPIIMGFTKHDGSHMLSPLKLTSPLNNEAFRKGIERTLQIHVEMENHLHASQMADALEFQYYPWHKRGDPNALKSSVIKLLTDYFIIAPTFKAADFHSKHAPTYLFLYSYLSSKSEKPLVAHGSNVDFGFGVPLDNQNNSYTDIDRNVSTFIMNCYSNFLKYGTPTRRHSGIEWPKYDVNNGAYMDIKAEPEIRYKFHPSRIAFWNFYVPRLLKHSCNSVIAPRVNTTMRNGSKTNSWSLSAAVFSFATYVLLFMTKNYC